MLIIQMPEGGDRKRAKRRRQFRALAYLVPAPMFLAAVFISMDSRWWWVTTVVEAWWLWAVWTDPGLRG